MKNSEDAAIRHAPLFVECITVCNFKGIGSLTVDLQPGLTLLVGRNNVGKSRILRALHIAIGGIPVERDDLTVGLNESAEIDLVVAPYPSGMHLVEVPSEPDSIAKPVTEMFDESLQGLLGDGLSVISTEPTQQRYAWRTTIEPTIEGNGARARTRVLAYSLNTNEYQPEQAEVPRSIRHLVHAELVETSRTLMPS